MIERDFIAQKTKEYYIREYIEKKLDRVGISQIKLKKIPLGEKIIIDTNRPSLVVGSKGANIKSLTKVLKKKFKLENPQIEINEVKNLFLDASLVADYISNSLERFGSKRFKGVGHRVLQNVINAGALGVEVIISGKIPGSRARSWRFYQGYLKKCGDISVSGVRKAQKPALLKSGIIGIKVSIMPSDLILPDTIEILDEPIQVVEELPVEKPKKKATKKKTTKKRVSKKKAKTVKKEQPIVATVPVKEVKQEEKVVEEIMVKEEPKQEVVEPTPVKEEVSKEPVKELPVKESPVEEPKEMVSESEIAEENKKQ
ncbi:30S ribosomal protein S3 [Candidatus Woesearchaeota archaeon]|jgi:small subunit ribosomal protein S3|nr:30S ribosomal protein S3 [Candidatus Woesearchaeota archaeon]